MKKKPSDLSYCEHGGLRQWHWLEVIEGWHLYNGARIIAKIAQEGEGWWVSHPKCFPEPPIEPLQAARKRAELMSLWALPAPQTQTFAISHAI